jgi:fumarate reductase flavoprotein subunit
VGTSDIESRLTADVVVIGAGFAGLSSALEASQLGAEVIVLSRTGLLANDSAISGGNIPFVGSPLQKEKGIKDSKELFTRDLLESNHNSVNIDLINVIACGAAELYDWLIGFGAEFIGPIPWPGHSIPRLHQEVQKNGSRLIKLMSSAAKERGADVRYGVAATNLITDDKGVVKGVKGLNKEGKAFEISASKGVVLAAGGFAKNREMLQKYIPKMVGWPTDTASGSTGDGIRMALEVGATTANMDSVVMGYRVLPKSGQPKAHPPLPAALMLALAGGIAVNKEGQRFMDESVSYSHGAADIMRQSGCTCFVIFDERTKSLPQLKNYEEVFYGKTIDGLAAELGIGSQALAKTISDYNDSVDKGTSPSYIIGYNMIRHHLEPPYYAIPSTTTVIMTHGGIKINAGTEVIRRDGNPIPGLFAAGDVAVGLCGGSEGYCAVPGYINGTGNLTALSFGRVAGRKAAIGR